MPELGAVLIHNKPVNTAADARPDVTPEFLYSSTVYFPLGISRGKRKLMGAKASNGKEVAEMVK